MIVISQSLVLAGTITDPDNPVIGWQQLVTASNIVADTEAAGFPASNLANPATHLKWVANNTTAQYLTITLGSITEVDYIGIARHNLYSAQIPVSIEAFIGGVWTEVVADRILPDDGPAIFQFTPTSLTKVRIRLQSGDDPASIAVVYLGLLLTMERGIYDNHTPLKYARKTQTTNGRSETGEFLGRIVTGEYNESNHQFSLISPSWFRENMPDFLDAAQETPFFIAWRPESYPYEVGYGWLQNDPMPVNQPPSKLIAIDLGVGGVV